MNLEELKKEIQEIKLRSIIDFYFCYLFSGMLFATVGMILENVLVIFLGSFIISYAFFDAVSSILQLSYKKSKNNKKSP